MVSVKGILDFLGPDVIQFYGNIEDACVEHLRPLETVDETTLDWVDSHKPNRQALVEASKAKVVMADPVVQYTQSMQNRGKILILVANPKLSLIRIGQHFFVEKRHPGIHPTACIHPAAKTGENLCLGANTSIGECVIGDNVTIYPNVVINDGVAIGNHVTIKSGAILGFDGFGYERDEANNWIKFPQLGKLIIEDHAEIGSNTCIDKGSLSDTIIGFNTKINNLCHIAHNTVTGRNVVITAQVNISGSTTIEDDVWIAPNATLSGHQTIGRGATIGTGAVVTKDVPAGETWVGNPARKIGT